MYKKVIQGELNTLTAAFTDIAGSEKLVLAIICILVIGIGVYPGPILHLSQAAVDKLLLQIRFGMAGLPM